LSFSPLSNELYSLLFARSEIALEDQTPIDTKRNSKLRDECVTGAPRAPERRCARRRHLEQSCAAKAVKLFLWFSWRVQPGGRIGQLQKLYSESEDAMASNTQYGWLSAV